MSYTQFSIHMGLYLNEYMDSQDYQDLQVDFAPMFILAHYWRKINQEHNYEAIRSKALTLWSLTLKYLHKLLVHTIGGQGDSIRMVMNKDLFYFYNMWWERERERVPIHLGACIGLVHLDLGKDIVNYTIMARLYIIRLIQGIRLFSGLPLWGSRANWPPWPWIPYDP